MKRALYIALTLLCVLTAFGKSNKREHLHIVFYNVENLFDTINQPKVIDEEFTPTGLNKWDTQRYHTKLTNISNVLTWIGGEQLPDLVGLAEIENRGVLEDLVATPALRNGDYQIAHIDSPDLRGVDCAFLYRKGRFSLSSVQAIPVKIPSDSVKSNLTRDILYVKGKSRGETLHLMVAHWPSRGGGEEATRSRRMIAAQRMKQLNDSILRTDRHAKVIMMGDLNDDPDSESILSGLKAHPLGQQPTIAAELYNPMAPLFANGQGTLAYRGKWNLFDMIIVNGNLLSPKQGYRLQLNKQGEGARILKDERLLEPSGRFKGTPLRTFVGKRYFGGYSDHLPVSISLIK